MTGEMHLHIDAIANHALLGGDIAGDEPSGEGERDQHGRECLTRADVAHVRCCRGLVRDGWGSVDGVRLLAGARQEARCLTTMDRHTFRPTGRATTLTDPIVRSDKSQYEFRQL